MSTQTGGSRQQLLQLVADELAMAASCEGARDGVAVLDLHDVLTTVWTERETAAEGPVVRLERVDDYLPPRGPR